MFGSLFVCLHICPFFFSGVLSDSKPLFVGPSVGPLVRRSIHPSVTLYFSGVNEGFGLIAPAQMFHPHATGVAVYLALLLELLGLAE